MITGWKEISNKTGFSRNTIMKLKKKEGFPLCFIAKKPVTTEQAIQKWLEKRLEANSATI